MVELANKRISIGDRFGKLTVIAPTEKGVVFDRNGKDIGNLCLHCRCDCGNEIDIRKSTLKTEVGFIRSCGCTKKTNINHSRKVMSKQEKDDWDSLYDFVRYNVLGYDQNQSLSHSMALRLKGLLVNKHFENYNIPSTANYSYLVILNTFKYSILDIRNALKTHRFNDENHKFNYILRIVESNINTVYLKMKEAEKTKKEVEQADVSRVNEYVNNFKPKPDKKRKINYDDMW